MNVIEFAQMLSETTGCEVKGFQSFSERPDEKQKMEAILSEHGTLLDTERFLSGEIKPAGLVIAYLNHQVNDAVLYEMSPEVSEKWRQKS